MFRSIASSVSQSIAIRRSRIRLIALWSLQIALATLFLLAGGSKLAGAPAMVAFFAAIGVGQWFRYVTGLIEIVSSVALLVPKLAPFGALLLASTMVGAIVTHLFVVGGSPAPPVPLLLGSLAVMWAHRGRLSAVLSAHSAGSGSTRGSVEGSSVR